MENATITRPAGFPDVEQLQQAVENIIDLDIVVLDCRQELVGAVDRLRAAVRDRDRAVDLLESLMQSQEPQVAF